jgi:universal stress protein A
MKIERILFPTDFSDQSVAALDFASDLAASFGAKLHIVYVDDLTSLIAKSPYVYPSFLTVTDRTAVKAQLKSVLPTIANVAFVHHFMEGEPSAGICALAEKERIDLIVMSSHGRSGLSRLLLGSVAENVLRHAVCPVLIVKQSPTAQAGTGEEVAAGCSHT